MAHSRRHILAAAAGAIASLHAPISRGQPQWPERPVRVISPYGAGGSNDISARLLSDHVGRRLGAQFIVENKPGAATRIANEFVARSKPDGQTFLYVAAPYATVESLYGKLSYDLQKDLVPIVLAVIAPVFLVVNADLPVRDVQEFIAFAKNKAGGVNFACTGVGAAPHLASELFYRQTGIKGQSVQYRGDAAAYTELLAGRVDAVMTAITAAQPHLKVGKLRVLAVAAEQRSALYPSAPTLAEQSIPGLTAAGWFGFMAPAKTEEVVIDRLGAEVNAALGNAATRQQLLALGLEPVGGTPAQMGSFIESERRRWSEVIKAANIKPE